MATLSVRQNAQVDPRPEPGGRVPLGRYLVDSGVITPEQLVKALHLQISLGAALGEILISEGWASDAQIQTALADQFGIARADLKNPPPDPALSLHKPASFWLRHKALPWKREGDRVLIATARPDRFERLSAVLGQTLGNVHPVQVSEGEVEHAIATAFKADLAKAAGQRVAPMYSCRSWHWSLRLAPPILLATCLTGITLAPMTTLAVLTLTAICTLAMFAALKGAASIAELTAPPVPKAGPTPAGRLPRPRPKVSVLVPLYHEREIVTELIQRLSRLTYPKALLDLILVLEEHDTVTRQTLARTALPNWIRVIEVPGQGRLTTKPRAMNYALDFCKGEIIGVWDAEDAPACDQIEQVVHRFAELPQDVVCLQGILDYYNPRTNWLARCFTIEYAALFRVILPGMARMGLVLPLGGTTLFFRRAELEELGGWDAHNVTEDADLGIRLCRMGYRTEIIQTVTYEEANCRPWAWVKQRSRWLKGFMVTYLVHMRRPGALLRDLGLWRFLGVQTFFLGTLSQFLLAPVLWSFWLMLLGLPHPLAGVVPMAALYSAAGFFLLVEIMSMAIGIRAVAKADRRFLILWAPALIMYFPLGAIAAYKAVCELVFAPYFWDKTEHGVALSEACPQRAETGFIAGQRPV